MIKRDLEPKAQTRLNEDAIMKSNDAKKEKKKAPLKTAKEKKLAKAEKKNKR
jgi:hypothetical protein